ncbi:hypothetical protein CAPTEDRAFT_226931 [Capitella teleta]|uniref:G-protein coupled receptors family 1 profile domain-containing protein n=1 Tax=Capitella teleta TaxID=283909 RepID=R7U9S1_CAPTE|nr:hypothetical protein CAPTEDRAFT_226931 [Capitella teleta]|eukprot:ELT99855.1 hypothetical protein CAPTEDRAFT_226931 [Capitella teleta]
MARLRIALLMALVGAAASHNFTTLRMDSGVEASTAESEFDINAIYSFAETRREAMYDFQVAATGLCALNYLLNGLSVAVFVKISKHQKQAVVLVMIVCSMARLRIALLMALVVAAASHNFTTLRMDSGVEASTAESEFDINAIYSFAETRREAMYDFQVAATGLCALNYLLNGLSVAVFVKISKHQKQAVILVMIGLCFADAVATVTYIDYIIWAYTDYSPMQNTDWGCRFFNWLSAVSKDCSNLFCLLIALERFVAVYFPLKVSLWFTRTRTVVTMAGMIVVFASLECFRFVSFHRVLYDGSYLCGRVYKHTLMSRNLGLVFTLVVGFLIPWGAISILNVCIIARLNRLRIDRKKISNKTNDDNNNHSLTLMFVSMAVFNLVCNGFNIYNVIYQLAFGSPYASDYPKIIISYCLVLTGHSFNMVFYALTGSKFRNILFGMLCCGRKTEDGSRGDSKNTKMSFVSSK